MRFIIVLLSLVIGIGEVFAGEPAIRVGVVLPLSGPRSSYGTETLRGINLAVAHINAKGGIKQRQLSLVVKDNAGDPAITAKAVASLIDVDEVMAVIGPITSTNAAAAAAVAQQKRTLLILPVATSPYVTDIGEFISRVCYTDPLQSKGLAQFTREHLKSDKVAIIYEKGSDYSEKLTEFFTMRFEDMGGKVLSAQSFEHNPASLDEVVRVALAAKPDVLFAPIYYPEAAMLMQSVKKLGDNVTLLGGDAWEAKDLFRLAENSIPSGNVYISSHFAAELHAREGTGFYTDFTTTHGVTPTAVSALGYDAVTVLADALGRTTMLTRSGLQQALVSTDGFKGVTGTISINEKRNVVKDLFILKIVDGAFVFETAISTF